MTYNVPDMFRKIKLIAIKRASPGWRAAAVALGVGMSPMASASPPPPPPEYVYAVGQLLTEAVPHDLAQEAALFADDVTVVENDVTVARGRQAWRAWRASVRARPERVLAYSESWDPGGAGDLLVLDTFDTVDRSDLPPNTIADPRMATRAILYQFHADRLIHAVRILRVDGFVRAPKH